MGCILWLHQTKKLIIVCIPDTDVTWNLSKIEDTSVGQKKIKGNIWSYLRFLIS